MGIVELLLIAVGLSMDAFAVSICKGLGMKKVDVKVAVVLALFFGGFQGLMPLIGWALGSQFLWLIAPIDHWIAFGLLAVIGGKMLWEALHDEEGEDDGKPADRIDLGEFFILAIATSIDALAVGISFAALSVDIVPSVLLIGIVTFAFTIGGVFVGNYFGSRYERPATITGGVVLILIGLKVLLEHLGLLALSLGHKGRGILSQGAPAQQTSRRLESPRLVVFWDKIPRPFCPSLSGGTGACG